MNPKKRKVLITGVDGALGHTVANRCLEEGFSVLGTCFRLPETNSQTQNNIQLIQMNLASPHEYFKLDQQEIDTLIHCAGGFRWAKTEDLKDQDLEFLIDSNLKSAFYLVRKLISGMKKQNFGRIVFVSARATLKPGMGMGAYAASKSGLNILTQSLAQEVTDFNINVNAVLPSTLDTSANRKDMPSADFSKWVSLADLTEIIFSLVQPWGRSIHGALIPVSGRV